MGIRWGAHCLAALLISICSGVVVALQYNPSEPFFSTLTLELVVPYGSFWRGLHYYSSQFFFLLLLIHLAVVIAENNHGYTRPTWIRLSASLPVALLLLFTGYILRGDNTGAAAGMIAENLALSIPLIGKSVNALLFAVSESSLKKVYAQHLIGLMVPGGYFIWRHLRRYQTRLRYHLPLTAVLLLCSITVPAPLEPDRPGAGLIAGPWFFLGLQELLRYLPPFWAGVFPPILFLAALLFLPFEGGYRRPLLRALSLGLLLYLALSLVGYQRIMGHA